MNSLIVGVAGGSGSGKTVFTRNLVARLSGRSTCVIPHDAYYRDIGTYGGRPPEAVNFDHPDALESALLVTHLEELKAGRGVLRPVYNFATHRRERTTAPVDPSDVVIVEGILIFADPRLRARMDLRIFVDVDADERLLRRIRRDVAERGRSVESVIRQYVDSVRPMHVQYVEPGREWADVIVTDGGENREAVEAVAARIGAMLAARPAG
jgi:uridine kinase